MKLAPVSEVDLTSGTKTELNYTNTLHRYPWICSLRTKGITAEHLCATTLLSVPPQPTIIVGPAHCTYLCKDGDARGARLQSCCCTPGPLGCSDDTLRCGKSPGAAEMDPNEVVILCGEWETGPAPQAFSGEQYNVVLEISEIIRHPAFDAGGLGVEGGSDLAIFKIVEEGLSNSSDLENINPICLPDPVRPKPREGIQSGWSIPPPLHYFREFGAGFLSFVTDTYKQWHYKLNIEDDCREPTKSIALGREIKFPSVAYYPPGLICAKEIFGQFCPNSGDSGSPLMVKNSLDRYSVEGVLSFLKGCDVFSMGERRNDRTKFDFTSYTESPLAYTKLSCYLPWVAEQYGLSYEDQPADDEACVKGSGQKPLNSTHQYDARCRETVGIEEFGYEHPCIFPFYYKEKRYDSCALLETSNFVVPVWRCPVFNITTKYKDTGINHFKDDLELTKGYCFDVDLQAATCDWSNDLDDGGPGCQLLIDPDRECEDLWKFLPFSTCKSDCPGGEHVPSN